MTKPFSKNVRLFTGLMIGVALIFSACTCLENYLLHPKSRLVAVEVCVKLNRYVHVDNVDALISAFKRYDKTEKLFKISVLRSPDGREEPPIGQLAECCKSTANHKWDGPTINSTTVTQHYKYQSVGTRDPDAEKALKEIIQTLGEAK